MEDDPIKYPGWSAGGLLDQTLPFTKMKYGIFVKINK
jgi:hypothetical protein